MARILPLACALALAACAGAPARPPTTTFTLCPPSGGQDCVGVADKFDVVEQTFTSFNPRVQMHLGNEAPLQLAEATWVVTVAGQQMGTGKIPLNRTLQPGELLEVTAKDVAYAAADKLSDVLDKEGALDAVMRGEVHTASGDIYAFSRAGDVRSPRVPKTKMWHIEVSSYADEGRLGMIFFVRVVNKNPFEIQVDELKYDLTVGGHKLVTGGIAGTKERIPASTGGQIEIPVDLTKQNYPEVAKIMRSWMNLSYELSGNVQLAIGHIPVTLTGKVGEAGDQADEEESKDTNTMPAEEKNDDKGGGGDKGGSD